MGRHALKFGGELFHVQYNRFESPSMLGDFQFTSGFTTRTARNDGTGDPLASFLLGLPAIASRAIGPSRIDGRQWSYSLYAQDDFNLTPKITINLGLRYELSPPMYDKHQQMSSIDYRNVPSPGAVFAEGKTGFYKPTMFICGQSGTPRGCAFTDRNNFAPRVGLVWSTDDKTVVRSGFGVFYAGNDLNPLFRLAAGLPGNIAQTLNSDNFIPRFRDFDVFGPAVVGPVQIQAAGIDMFQRTSYSLQWNLSVATSGGEEHHCGSGIRCQPWPETGTERTAEQRLAGNGSRGSSPALPRAGVRSRHRVPELPDGARKQRPGRIHQLSAAFSTVELSCRAAACREAFQRRHVLPELVYVLESDHECASIPECGRRRRRGELAFAGCL